MLMLYELLLYEIDGKLYNSVKYNCQSAESCVRINWTLQISLIVKLVLNREIIYLRLYFFQFS